ncbi:MAG: hypothetical protein ABS52_18670 [Gemmatimonadetes bacterium SCN 70-22]|nr:MAG: hypothetical protein ABS52_18670 [Gemmatimonadetes bacterium SCN 70-22]
MGVVAPLPPPAPPGGQEEFVAPDGRFGATSLVGERGAMCWGAMCWGAMCWGAMCRGATTSSNPIGRRSCSSDPGGIRSDPFPSTIARCHTAAIGNLGMRTQATRHCDCTANLHDVMRSSLLHRHLQNERWASETRDKLREQAAKLDAVLQTAGFAAVGGTALFRLVRHRHASAYHTTLARRRIWCRRFDWADDLLRFGLPLNDAALERLALALADI